MAYIYPYAGHNRNTVTTNNADNQPITPPHQNSAYNRVLGSSPHRTLLHKASALIALFLFSTFFASLFAQTQTLTWGNSNTPFTDNSVTIECGTVYILTGNTRTDAAVTFTADDASSHITVYCANDNLRGNDNNRNTITLSGGATNKTYTSASDPRWQAAGSYTTTGRTLTIAYDYKSGNNNSTWTAVIICGDFENDFIMSNGLDEPIECGKTYLFFDDGGPTQQYSNTNGDYTATFRSSGNITLTFISFSSRTRDNISVYNGGTGGTLLIDHFTGNNTLPGNNPVTATDNTMTVVWHNGADDVRNGWIAVITADCSTPWSTGTTTTLTCGETLTVKKSPGTADANGGMTFTLPQASIAAGCHIKVTLKSDNLNLTARQRNGGNRYDNLSVYNGTSNAGTQIGTAWQSTVNGNGTVTQPNLTGNNGFRTSANGQSSVHVYFTNGNSGGGGGGTELDERKSSFTFTVECVDCGSTPSCSTDPAFDNCPDELESGTTWNPHWNTSATPTGWTTSNASYSAGTVTAGSTIGNASVSATVDEDIPYCAGTLSCTFNVVCNTSRSLTLSSASGTVVAGNDITATITNTTGQNITWSSDNTGIATASQSSNTLTIHGVSAGQTTIRGRINQYTTGGVTYCAQDVTYEVTVTAGSTSCDGTETTVGNGSDYFSTYGPVYNYWEYGYRQIIYDPEDDDICGGTISKIAFNYYSGTSFTRNPVTIYMGESPKEAFQSTSDWITDLSGFTTVYQGSLSFTTTGWQWINLQNTFNYSGQDNLVVIIKDDNGSYGSSYYFYTHTTTGNRQIYAYDDDAYNTANPGTAYDVTNYRPDTKFCIDCCTDWDADFHYTTTSASIVAGTSYTNTTLVNNTAYNVSYTISPSMAGVSISSSGEVTTPANIEQTFTVTATIQRGGEYCDKKTTYTLDVGDGCNKIGNGSTQIDGPIVPGYRNSYMEMIYTYSEIGEYCRISRIAFNYKQTGTVSRHLKIYMTQDSKSEFDNRGDFIGSNNMTLVWEGDWTFSEGWNVFELTTPFDYTSGNIIIGVNSHASYYERSTGFNGESDDYNRVLSSFYGPEEITSDHMDTWCTNHSSYYEINYYRPNIKFCMDCCNLEAEIQFGDPEP